MLWKYPGQARVNRLPHSICLRRRSIFALLPTPSRAHYRPPRSLSSAPRLVTHASTNPFYLQLRRHQPRCGLAGWPWRGCNSAISSRAVSSRGVSSASLFGRHPNSILPLFMHPGSCCAAAAAGGGPVDGPPSRPGLTLVAPVCQLLHHVNCFCHLALAIAVPVGLPLTGPLGEARQ